jgi:hypothetical protein
MLITKRHINIFLILMAIICIGLVVKFYVDGSPFYHYLSVELYPYIYVTVTFLSCSGYIFICKFSALNMGHLFKLFMLFSGFFLPSIVMGFLIFKYTNFVLFIHLDPAMTQLLYVVAIFYSPIVLSISVFDRHIIEFEHKQRGNMSQSLNR